MKKLLIILIIFPFLLEAQENKFFSDFYIGFYSGLNFFNTKNVRGDIFVEFKTSLISSLKLKVSAGYNRTIHPYTSDKTVRAFSEVNIDTLPIFFASKYNLVSRDYDIFPFSLGIQYNFFQDVFSPYLSMDVVYNFINSSIRTSPPEVWSYNSITKIPDEFKVEQENEILPKSSYGIALGAGTTYKISPKLNLDVRYLFKFDSEIINTHHFILGIYF